MVEVEVELLMGQRVFSLLQKVTVIRLDVVEAWNSVILQQVLQSTYTD